jgi:hypothetical protein
MTVVTWWGRRMAELQFGRVIQGLFQVLMFIPLYLKMYHFRWYVWALLILAFTLLTWFSGWLAYHFKFVEAFRKKEFKGILGTEEKP